MEIDKIKIQKFFNRKLIDSDEIILDDNTALMILNRTLNRLRDRHLKKLINK